MTEKQRCTPSEKKKMTPKKRVLKMCPNAYAAYDSVYGWHVRNGIGGAMLSVGFGASAPAWREALSQIK